MHTRRHSLRTRHLIPALIVLLLLLPLTFLPSTSARAATDTVTNCDASGPGSLPAVLAAANADDTITFAQDCTGTNAITLIAQLIPLVNVAIDATTPLHVVTINGGGRIQLFVVHSDITLGLRGLTLANGNSPVNGGAIYNDGTVNVVGSIFFGNGAINSVGGAIVSSGTVNVVSSLFAHNAAPNGGGAIYNYRGALTVVGSTFSGNAANSSGISGGITNNDGTLLLMLSVVAGNTADGGSDIFGTVTTDGGGNVIGNTVGSMGLTASNDKMNVNPLLAPLGDNGGTVQTFALLPGSPAIAIAPCPIDPTTGAILATDARRVPRPQDANCDAGSYQTTANLQAPVVTHAVNDSALRRNMQ